MRYKKPIQQLFTILLCSLFIWENTANAQYIARITQVDTSRFPIIRAYVSITDTEGNPITVSSSGVNLNILEEGTPVVTKKASLEDQPLKPVWSVLTLDLSGSMRGEKLQKAKEAAITYVNLAPHSHKIAIVGFSNKSSIVSDFSYDKDKLRTEISNLSANGQTALQDGIAMALDMLNEKSDRKVVITLTDGIENKSTAYSGYSGYQQLLQRSAQEESSISVIGLGSDVNTDYLTGYMATGGEYFFSPDASELQKSFKNALVLLEKEIVIEYKTSASSPDGTLGKLKVNVSVGNITVPTEEIEYVRPGVIPHVRGNHLPYLILLIIMLFAPRAFYLTGKVALIYRFRNAYIKQLEAGSEHLGKRDPNFQGKGFQIGEKIVTCPTCKRPHNPRSWRLNRCRCMHEHVGRGTYCYHSLFPRWMRDVLDFLSGKHSDNETGRTWRCHCAGDKEGY